MVKARTVSVLVVLVMVAALVALPACTSAPSSTSTSTSPPPTTTTTTLPPTTTTTSPPTTTTPPPTTTTSSALTINLIAQNVAFNVSTITVPAGAKVTVNFDNKDAQVPHNFAVYQSGNGATGTASGPIFVGETILGPSTIVYQFTAPSAPGDYFFRCDVHPTIMFGTFIVQ
jgi:plastocyanin